MSEIVSRVHHDHADRTFTWERVQDVEPVLDLNRHLSEQKQTRTDGLRHYANIPAIFVEKWLNEFYERSGRLLRFPSNEFDEEIADKKLRDPENAWMKVGGPEKYMGVKWLSPTIRT
jgi:hypothetical protein